MISTIKELQDFRMIISCLGQKQMRFCGHLRSLLMLMEDGRGGE
jgi:hypothetical protein